MGFKSTHLFSRQWHLIKGLVTMIYIYLSFYRAYTSIHLRFDKKIIEAIPYIIIYLDVKIFCFNFWDDCHSRLYRIKSKGYLWRWYPCEVDQLALLFVICDQEIHQCGPERMPFMSLFFFNIFGNDKNVVPKNEKKKKKL